MKRRKSLSGQPSIDPVAIGEDGAEYVMTTVSVAGLLATSFSKTVVYEVTQDKARGLSVQDRGVQQNRPLSGVITRCRNLPKQCVCRYLATWQGWNPGLDRHAQTLAKMCSIDTIEQFLGCTGIRVQRKDLG